MLVASMAELTIEPGSVDDEIYTMIKFKDWDSINGYVMNGGISSSGAQEVLNDGYCLEYMQAWKDAGKIPADFVPTSQKSQASSSNASNANNTDMSTTNTTTPATSEKKQNLHQSRRRKSTRMKKLQMLGRLQLL